jgi:hypothetical protein
MSGVLTREIDPILPSAARTTVLQGTSVDQTNYRHRGVMLMLDITANPGGAETLTLQVQAKLNGKYRNITAFTAATAAANATWLFTVYPGAAETAAVANHEVQALPLPRVWRVVVTPSASGSFTYEVAGCYLI